MEKYEKTPVSRADTARLGKYCTGSYGRIGVYRVVLQQYVLQIFMGLSEGKPTRMRRLCLKTSEAEGRGGLGITSSSEEVYELML